MRVAVAMSNEFAEDLDQLRASVCEMGGRVEAAVAGAVSALVSGDAERARRVAAEDFKVDALATGVERHAVQLLERRAPQAEDLRDVLAAYKIAGLIARIGDCASNVARRTEPAGGGRVAGELSSLAAMGEEVLAMLKTAFDAYVRRDAGAAARLEAMDDLVDRYRSSIARGLIELMAADSRQVGQATELMFAAQKLERIGDHAVAIAEMVAFAAGAEALEEAGGC